MPTMPALKGVNKKLSFLFRKHKLVAFKHEPLISKTELWVRPQT